MRWLVLMIWPTVAAAQGAECYDDAHLATLPQQPLNRCALYRYQQADAELNRIWQELESSYGAMSQLREAQRVWIQFRDLACEAEADAVLGGSLYPMVHSGCMERQTLRRIEDLRQFGDLR